MTSIVPSITLPFSISEAPLGKGFVDSCKNFGGRAALQVYGKLYTYSELENLVKQVYAQISNAPIADKSRIAIICQHDVQTYAAVLAVSLYGAAYVPLHSANPAERILQMATDAGATLVLSSKHYDFTELKTDLIFQEIKIEDSCDLGAIPIPIVQQPLAYIMFTSGSSGKPKAVGITKIQANHYLQLALKEQWWHISAQDRFLQAFELSFDASVQWLFMPLALGASVYVPDSMGNKSMNIAKCLMDEEVTFAMMPPTVVQVLKPYLQELYFPQLRYSLFGGEVLNANTAKAWANCSPNAVIENHYGPTEATIWCTRHIVDREALLHERYGATIPIGSPYPEIDTLLIDNGISSEKIGELCLSGVQVISQYLNAVNTERFIVIDNKTYYRTGDWVEKIDNVLYFKGRIDNQVKVSGYRIEPEEIEHAITAITQRSCFVAVSTNHNGQLVALIEQNPFTKKELTEALQNKLPNYMVPSVIVYTKSIPINENGKINRSAALKILENIAS